MHAGVPVGVGCAAAIRAVWVQKWQPLVPAYGVGVQKTDLFSLLLNTAAQPSMAEVLAMSTAAGATVSPSRPAASTGKTV